MINNQIIRQPIVRLIAKILLDIAAILAAFLVSYLIRFPLDLVHIYINDIIVFIPILIVLQVIVFAVFRLYSLMWRYSDIHMLKNLVLATTLVFITLTIFSYFSSISIMPRSILVLNWVFVIFFCGGIKLLIRYIYSKPWKITRKDRITRRVLIYGAGNGGEILLRNFERTGDVPINVVGFLDDNPQKKGQYIHNKKVLGDRKKIGELVNKHKINDIIMAIPSLSGTQVRTILKTIQEQVGNKIEIKKMPSLSDLVDGRISINQLKKFEIKDLLRRNPVHLDFTPVKRFIHSNSVLVVGGGGSIGQELCRQIASFEPAQLLVLDNSEYNLYSAETELKKQYPNLNLVCLVSDACNEVLMRKIFKYYKPEVIFHAAAYKHVPLMEMNPWAAVYNNLKNTLVLTALCREFAPQRFILISTDKAVQPTSVMGATKRICEVITLLQNSGNVTKYIAVRFGNVLGSSGSVVPKFQQQIAAGESITITHREITRYIMLIPEAVELVLQAGAVGENGNIYVLDMGEPIRILDLAKYMIELSGLKLDEDIKITFTGLRPGEKLHESLFLEGEESATHIPNLFVLKPVFKFGNDYLEKVRDLVRNCDKYSHAELRAALKVLVPEYEPERFEHFPMPFSFEEHSSIPQSNVVLS